MDEKNSTRLNSIEHEYKQITDSNLWFQIYNKIKEESEAEAKKRNFTTNESKKIPNRRLNRYRDVNPYDHTRIVLKRKTPDGIDYINANFVKLEKAKRQYVLCQGPLEHTVGHFWLMVWEQNSKAILMLNKIIEKKQVKCHLYWPKDGQRLELRDVGLAVEFIKAEHYKNFSKRLFRITDLESTKSREVLHYQYSTWPDFGVPSSPIAFLQFLKQVRDSGALDENVGPPVIHCSAGIGRSGTFCLVDCCLVLIDKEGENHVSVQDVLLELRRHRMGLIQTHDQLTFSYEAIIEGIKRMNNDTFNELDNLEIATAGSDPEEETAPPLPPRTSSKITVSERPLPVSPPEKNALREISEPSSDSTTSDVSEIVDDSSDDSSDDSDDKEETKKLNGGQTCFDANSNLPPVPVPNGTLDLTSPDKQKFSSDEERSPLSNENNKANVMTSELRHRNRVARQEAMQDKIREIKRKQHETESKKISLPKKRRSLILSIVSGVIILSVFAYVYVKS